MTRLSLRNLAHIAFGVAVSVILVLGWVAYHSTLQVRASTGRVSHYDPIFAILIATITVGLGVLVTCYAAFVAQSRARNSADRKLRDMADSFPGAAYRIRSDPDGSPRGTMEFVSASVVDLLGVSREALLENLDRLWERVHPEDRAAMVAAIERGARTGEQIRFDFRATNARGEMVWLRSRANVRREPDGTFLWNGYWVDATKQRQVEAELLEANKALEEAKMAAEAANRAKSIFLATMSHEIRTPMNVVLGMLELLSLTALDGGQRTTLATVRESGKSLLRIIDDILDFSKIEAGRLEVRPTVASIASAVQAVVNIYSGNASSKRLELSYSIDPNLSPAVRVDPIRLRQILNNLVSNGLKYTVKGGVELKVQLVERVDGREKVRFSVIDTGVGISEEDQARLFQPFERVAGEVTSRIGGTGLGLTICRRLAAMMGGSIEMVSVLGTGTTMILELSLPIADAKDLPVDNTVHAQALISTVDRLPPDPERAEAEGTLVLLVDDHPTNRSMILLQLNKLGYAAEGAANGLEALEKWRSGRFGLLITDCNMPQMDGYELTRRIRRAEVANGNKRTPVIACTANALDGEAELCFLAGMDDYLAKPVELSELSKKLDQWLPTARLASALDRSVLIELAGGDGAAAREIMIDFRRATDEDAARLIGAVERSDIAQVTIEAHRIKGASRSIGAVALAAVCEELERAGRARDLESVKSKMEAFQLELERFNNHCESQPWALAS